MNSSKTMHLIYASDANYVMPITVSAASLAFGANRSWTLTFHVLDLGMKDGQWASFVETVRGQNENVSFDRIHMDVESLAWLPPYHDAWSPYARLFVFSHLDDSVEWALYVDGDTLCVGDVTQILENCDSSKWMIGSRDPLPLQGNEHPDAVWCREHHLPIDMANYICSGLVLFNVQKLKKADFEAKVVAFMHDYECPSFTCADQTIINILCYGKLGVLPRQWGVFSVDHRDIDWRRPVLVHYAGEVPWKRDKPNRLMSDVVMLWYAFAEGRLHLKISSVPCFSRLWRRFAFLVLKRNQWIVRLHPFLAAKFRNVYGIQKEVYKDICRW